jgi:hypothetical protein
MIKAKIKQGSTTLATVEDTDDEKAIKSLSICFDRFMEEEINLRVIIDWTKE